MASCSSHLYEEDQFLCSICLGVFVDPVSTMCGHNFCKACITQYWDSKDLCQCPMCMKTFDKRPDLLVNTFISEMAAPFRRSVPVEAASGPDPHPVSQVSCDICIIGKKRSALKSCLSCQASYCETHLGPHLRATSLIQHKLIDPVENLEDRMCETHNRPLELFCRTDQTCVCQFCSESDHKSHDTVPLEEEYREQKVELVTTGEELQQMIQERLQKVQSIKLSVEKSKRDTAKEISDSVEVFTALVRSVEKSQAELVQVIEEKQKVAEKQAAGFIKDLEQEITDLRKRSSELEQLSHSEDHFHFLQSFPALSTRPHTKDWSDIRVHSDVAKDVRRAVSQLKVTLKKEMEKLPQVKLKRIQQRYAVDVTLDPATAHRKLLLSKERVTYDIDAWNNLPDNPEKFTGEFAVLGKQSFSSGRFYYEVYVDGNTGWTLGVVRGSIDRKRKMTIPNTADGIWAVSRIGNDYWATNDPDVLLLREKPQKVGVFVDFKEGEVFFYDVEAKSQIYVYAGCNFTENLYPYFNPHKGSNTLIITPVSW